MVADTLEQALQTLPGLNQMGKLTGLISHLPALKERSGMRIEVTPQSGRRSVIKGPDGAIARVAP